LAGRGSALAADWGGGGGGERAASARRASRALQLRAPFSASAGQECPSILTGALLRLFIAPNSADLRGRLAG